MSQQPMERINLITLQIQDEKLAEEYRKSRYQDINKISRIIAISKLCYGLIVLVQTLMDHCVYSRPTLYIFFVLLHYFSINYFEKFPSHQFLHSSVSMLSFVSFTLNDASNFKSPSEQMSLLLGFIGSSYLSCTFLSLNWMPSSLCQMITAVIISFYFHGFKQGDVNYEFMKFAPALFVLSSICAINSYYVELKGKIVFLEIQQNEILQKDLKKVIQVLPEGVMIYKRYGDNHIKLWNKELEQLFNLQNQGKDDAINDSNSDLKSQSMKIKDKNQKRRESQSSLQLDINNLKDILVKKILLPVPKLSEGQKSESDTNFENPVLQRKPLSIETALIYGEQDRFYNIIDSNKEVSQDEDYDLENSNVVGLNVINIQYDNDPCSMILFRNWTHNFKYQFAKTQRQLQEMITATVSHEMRTPINAILTQLTSLEMILAGQNDSQKLTRVIKNSATLLLYLVNDMLDVYMIKNGRFQKIHETFKIKSFLKEIYEMFQFQTQTKGLSFNIKVGQSMPYQVTTDQRRLKQIIINLISNALKFTQKGGITIDCNFNQTLKQLNFSVQDTGLGIRKNDQVKLFKMFGKLQSSNKQNQQGIGLGLSVCKKIINVYNGEITINSELGIGSNFSFTFEVLDFDMQFPADENNDESFLLDVNQYCQINQMMRASIDDKISQGSLNAIKKGRSSQAKNHELSGNQISKQLNESQNAPPTISVIEEESMSLINNSDDRLCNMTQQQSHRKQNQPSLYQKIMKLNFVNQYKSFNQICQFQESFNQKLLQNIQMEDQITTSTKNLELKQYQDNRQNLQSERIQNSRKNIVSIHSIEKQKTQSDVYKIVSNNNTGSENIQKKKMLRQYQKNKSNDTHQSSMSYQITNIKNNVSKDKEQVESQQDNQDSNRDQFNRNTQNLLQQKLDEQKNSNKLKKNESKNSLIKSKSAYKRLEKSLNQNDYQNESLENDQEEKEIQQTQIQKKRQKLQRQPSSNNDDSQINKKDINKGGVVQSVILQAYQNEPKKQSINMNENNQQNQDQIKNKKEVKDQQNLELPSVRAIQNKKKQYSGIPQSISKPSQEKIKKKKKNLRKEKQDKSQIDVPQIVEDQITQILIVDDNIFNLSTLQTMIKIKFKIESLTASSGEAALDHLKQRIQEKQDNEGYDQSESPFKIVFMDCNMPEMDGFQTTQNIVELCQKNSCEIPYIVALTAHSKEDQVLKKKCYESGMNQCMSKPISIDQLKELFIRLNVNFHS